MAQSRFKAALAAMAIACAPGALAQERHAEYGAAAMNGVWLGEYAYTQGGPGVAFQMRLESEGASFTGQSIEANTFADPARALFLPAAISGAVAPDGAVHFVKTYDGTADQSHSVDYNGRWDGARRCLSGAWRIGPASGPFHMCLPAKASAKS